MLIVIQVLVLYCALTSEYQLKFEREIPFENTLMTSFSLWTSPGLGSSVKCAEDCAKDRNCVSFFYNSQRDECTAHSVHFYPSEPSVTDVGSVYYTRPIDRQDCADILCNHPTSPDGVYTINPQDGKGPIRVYCDMTTDGGGWTVFQRRQDGTTNFYKAWADYKNGFGNMSGEFWLGNDIISRLTTARASELRVDMMDHSDESAFATYSSFRVENEADKYRLRVNGYAGDAGDSLQVHDGFMFTTWDQDNDVYTWNCAETCAGAWWYNDCHDVNLNGLYDSQNEGRMIVWFHWHGDNYSLKRTEMKLRPTQMCNTNG